MKTKVNRKTTQTGQAAQHPPSKNRWNKIQNKTEKNWTKNQASAANPKHKSKSFDSVGRTVERRFRKNKQFISFLINLTLYSHCIQVGRIKKSLKIPKGVIRIRISKKNRQPNSQKYKRRSTKHTYKTKDRVARTPLKMGGGGVNSCAAEG